MDVSSLTNAATYVYNLQQQMLTTPPTGAALNVPIEFPGFLQSPAECDPPTNLVYTTTVTYNSVATTHQGSFDIPAISMDFDTFEYTIKA